MLVLLLSAWDGLGRLMMFCVFVLFSCTFEIVCFGQTDILFRSSCWLKLTLVSQWVSWFYIIMTARELFKANRFNIALNSECNLCRIKDSFAVFTDGIVHFCLFCLCRNVVGILAKREFIQSLKTLMYSATDVQYYSKLWTHMQFPNAKANNLNEKPARFFYFSPRT